MCVILSNRGDESGLFYKTITRKLFRKFRYWLVNIQDGDTLATKYPEDHRSVLKEVQTSKEYSIDLTTLSRKMYDEK